MTKRTICKTDLAKLIATVFQEDQVSDSDQAYHLGKFLEHCQNPYATPGVPSEQHLAVEIAWFENEVPIYKANVEVD